MDASIFREYLKKLGISSSVSPSVEQKKETQQASTKPAVVQPPKAMSFFAADTVVEGSIFSESDIRIEGVINGNVTCKGNIELSGTVVGNIEGKNILITQAKINGDIKTEESLYTTNSTLTGNIYTQTADINSAVKGDITASRMLVIRKAASIKGNISAASISIEENAFLDGSVCVYQEEKKK